MSNIHLVFSLFILTCVYSYRSDIPGRSGWCTPCHIDDELELSPHAVYKRTDRYVNSYFLLYWHAENIIVDFLEHENISKPLKRTKRLESTLLIKELSVTIKYILDHGPLKQSLKLFLQRNVYFCSKGVKCGNLKSLKLEVNKLLKLIKASDLYGHEFKGVAKRNKKCEKCFKKTLFENTSLDKEDKQALMEMAAYKEYSIYENESEAYESSIDFSCHLEEFNTDHFNHACLKEPHRTCSVSESEESIPDHINHICPKDSYRICYVSESEEKCHLKNESEEMGGSSAAELEWCDCFLPESG